MGWSYFHITLAVGMLVTGSINTLATKLADITSSTGLDSASGDTYHEFNHPFFQALGMFLGELACLSAYFIQKYRDPEHSSVKAGAPFSPWIFLAPAMCDMAATSLMYVGLTLTYASVFQMLRGSVVIFTGIMSVVFLKTKLQRFQWFGMFLVLVGLLCVGLSSVIGSDDDDDNAKNPILGDILIVCAQLIVATQMVIEEKYVSKYNVPALQVVGLEGLFGFIGTSLMVFLFYWIPGDSAGGRLENAPDALVQMYHSWIITLALAGTVFSIAFFNWFGISVTKAMNATTRMVLDSLRTFIIWGISLAIGWQKFNYMQVIGFVLLLSGTGVYNKIIPVPCCPNVETKGGLDIQGDNEQPSGTYMRYDDDIVQDD